MRHLFLCRILLVFILFCRKGISFYKNAFCNLFLNIKKAGR